MSSRKLLEVVPSAQRDLERADIFPIHGFSYDPNSGESDDNPHNNFYPLMEAMLPKSNIHPLEYYSVPKGVWSLLKSWRHGRWNRYRYAWDLAEKHAEKVAYYIDEFAKEGSDINFIVHSLGSKVLFDALDYFMSSSSHANPVKRVIIFNGADHREHVEAVMLRMLRYPELSSTQFLNVFTKTDKVLSALGGHFAPVEAKDGKHYRHLLGRFGSAHKECIGRKGSPLLHNNKEFWWADLDCTFPRYPVDAPYPRNNAVIGDEDDNIGDHAYTLKHAQNWKVFRPFMEGKYQIIRHPTSV